MRLYFATPRYDAAETTAIGFFAGIRNVLVSYANVKEPRNGFSFWAREGC